MPFDIFRPTDKVQIQIINAHPKASPDDRQILFHEFMVSDEENELKTQRPADISLPIENENNEIVANIRFQAIWIYNKRFFLEDLMKNMLNERSLIIDDMRLYDQKLQLISKPFGGYRNIIDLDDVHLEDPFLTPKTKEWLRVSQKEEQFNVYFNTITYSLGLSNAKWGKVAIYMFVLWSLITGVICFQKADFLNLTMAILGLFMMLDPQQIKLSYLRLMVWVLPPTLIYDIFWIWHKHTEYWEDKIEGGMA